LVEHLNHTRDFLAMTQVRFETQAEPIAFFAMQRDHMILLCAPANEHLQTLAVEEMETHELSCLLERGTVSGKFRTLRRVRVSDYISQARGFFLLEDCDLVLSDRWGRTNSEDRRPHVLVNVHHVIGVAEESPASGPG
jgi:hypothetical protein